jgi:hypothetical protein
MPYGPCPKCGGKGISRERSLDGYTRCENGHKILNREWSKQQRQVPVENNSNLRDWILRAVEEDTEVHQSDEMLQLIDGVEDRPAAAIDQLRDMSPTEVKLFLDDKLTLVVENLTKIINVTDGEMSQEDKIKVINTCARESLLLLSL